MDKTNLIDVTDRLGLGGDTDTFGPQTLNDFTAIDSKFLDLMNGMTNSTRKTSQNRTSQAQLSPHQQAQNSRTQLPPALSQSSVKRNPEDIVRQLQINHKRRPLIENQKTIQTFRNENLELKLQLHRLNRLLVQRSINPEDANNDDEIKRDIIDELLARNEQLQRQLDERDRKDKNRLRERGCQTNLDSMNIEKLVEASVTLKRQAEEQRHLLTNRRHKEVQCNPIQPTPSRHQHSTQNKQQHSTTTDKRTQQQQTSVMTQIHYPIVTLPKQQPTSSGSRTPMSPDEKQLLEMVFDLNGRMTTIFDKLKAVSDSH